MCCWLMLPNSFLFFVTVKELVNYFMHLLDLF
nr:MAG TPA: hypothetical protein [Caudoviricetes sp.]